MLRIDLLRHLPQSPDGNSSTSLSAAPGGTWKPVLFIMLGLLIAGGAVMLWMQQERWIHYFRAAETGPTRAEILRANLEQEASELVLGQQSASIDWLYELEALTVSGARLTRAIFVPPGEFRLRGTVPTDAALSRIQESLVLLPEMNLRLSRSSATEDGYEFLFAGDLTFPDAGASPAQKRIVEKNRLSAEMEAFRRMATSSGLQILASEPGTATPSSHLQVHTWKLSVSSEITVLREFLNTARYRNSPFGIQRVTILDGDSTHPLPRTTLDILTFSR